MTAELTHRDNLPKGMTTSCDGCNHYNNRGSCEVGDKEFCAEAAHRLKLNDPSGHFWYDPLVHITNRLKS